MIDASRGAAGFKSLALLKRVLLNRKGVSVSALPLPSTVPSVFPPPPRRRPLRAYPTLRRRSSVVARCRRPARSRPSPPLPRPATTRAAGLWRCGRNSRRSRGSRRSELPRPSSQFPRAQRPARPPATGTPLLPAVRAALLLPPARPPVQHKPSPPPSPPNSTPTSCWRRSIWR